LLLLVCGNLALAQTAKPTASRSASQDINEWVNYSEKELLGMAEDMPEDKYNFAPTNGEFRGVRNFGKQVKHAAAAMQLISAAILGDPVPADAADERGPDSARTKAEIIKYLKDSYACFVRYFVRVITRQQICRYFRCQGPQALSHLSFRAGRTPCYFHHFKSKLGILFLLGFGYR
jgi:hypothetical protein